MNKNTCLSIVLLSLVSCSIQADYRMIVGLEDSVGGNLPDNSIIFTTGRTGNGDGGSGNIPDDGNDYSVFGEYAAVAKAIVNNPNPEIAVSFDEVLYIFRNGVNLNEYKTLQDFGYRFGVLSAMFGRSDYNSASSLITLHNDGYNLDRLANAGWYIEDVYGISLRDGVNKIIGSYKIECWNELDPVFLQMDISQWDNYASQHNCLK